MAQSGYNSIALYHSTTPGAQPSASNLVEGELALNIADGYLFFKRSGVVQNIAGLSGYSGISGYSGYSGYSGISGYSGFSGISGYSGFSGISGYSGFSGISGYSGQNGGGGTSGISGYSGYSGSTGVSGFSGYSGATGPTTYPGVGIPLSTGSAWGTSFNNSSNPISIGYGGTGQISFTTGQIHFGSFSTSANLFWDNGNTRLGVGLNNPVATLHVRGGNSNNAIIDNGGQQYTTLGWYNNGTEKAQTYWDQTNSLFVSGTDVAAAYVFKTNTAEAMRIAASGGVSVGTATDAGASNLLVNGNVVASSDERLKTNWQNLDANFIEKLAGVKHGIYDRIDMQATHVGVSAQSLQTVLSQAVSKGSDGLLSVNYGNAALVAAIELANEIVVLRKKIKKLEGN